MLIVLAVVLPLAQFGLAAPAAQAQSFIIDRVTVAEVPPDFGSHPQGITVKINWFTTLETYGEIDYGTTTSYGSAVGASSGTALQHEVQIGGLKGETTYHFKLVATSASGERLESFDQTFKTSKFVDTTLPVISDVRVTYVGGTYFIATWTTDQLTDSGVDVSTNPTFGRAGGAGGNSNTISHEVVVGGLRTNTLYYYRVHSRNSNGNVALNGGYSVVTAPNDSGDRAPLVLSQISPVSWPDPLIAPTAITFTWHTNQPSRGTVNLRGVGGRRVDEQGYLTLDHIVSIANLKPNTVYVATISSNDPLRHGVTSGDITLHTSSYLPPVAPPPTVTPSAQVLGASCVSPQAYGVACRNLALERKVAAQLKAALTKYFKGQVPRAARANWFALVRAAAYGHYPAQAIIQAVRFSGKTVHPSIPWEQWQASADYRAYINR